MKLTKKLFITIMTMALLVVTFSASTFAWFTLGQEAKIDNFNVHVESGAGMEISLDGKTWRNKISLLDNASDVEFTDLTSKDGIAIKTMENAVALNAPKTETVEGQTVTTLAQYLELTFYVRVSTNAGALDYSKVQLDSVSGKDRKFGTDFDDNNANANKWLSDATLAGPYTPVQYGATAATAKTLEENKYYEFDALNAVKMSFEANDKGTAAFIYGYENDKNWGSATVDGLANDYAVYKGITISNDVKTGFAPSYTTYKKAESQDGTDMVKYDAIEEGASKALVLNDTNAADFLTASEFKTKYASPASGTEGQEGYVPAGELYVAGENATQLEFDDNYQYAKVTIRIWLEGWDADCINAILDQDTVLNIVLKAVK